MSLRRVSSKCHLSLLISSAYKVYPYGFTVSFHIWHGVSAITLLISLCFRLLRLEQYFGRLCCASS